MVDLTFNGENLKKSNRQQHVRLSALKASILLSFYSIEPTALLHPSPTLHRVGKSATQVREAIEAVWNDNNISESKG